MKISFIAAYGNRAISLTSFEVVATQMHENKVRRIFENMAADYRYDFMSEDEKHEVAAILQPDESNPNPYYTIFALIED